MPEHDMPDQDMPEHDTTGTISWRSLLAETTELLGDAVVARWVCEEASGAAGAEFTMRLDDLATARAVARLDAIVARIRAGEPVQYALGHWAFRRLDLLVDRRVLIPRPETEWVVEHALGLLASRERPWTVVDLGTGSGAIGLSIAAERWHRGMQVWLTDASADALDVARANTSGIGRAAAAVRVVSGSWFAALPPELAGRVDLVIANPPYVADGDPQVEAVVREWEPASALFAGADGLDDLRVIVADAPRWLAPGGALVLEIGSGQGATVAAMAAAAGLDEIRVSPDLAGHDRIVSARRMKSS